MGRTLFIADAHLTPGDEKTFALFTRFVKKLLQEESGRLFIMGDFFDFWFEYKNFVMSSYFSVLEDLRLLTRAGWQVDFIIGNHDFPAGKTLETLTGMQVHDYVDLHSGTQKYRLEHGDLQMGNDITYHIWCFIMRRKITMFFWSLLPPLLVDGMIALIIQLSRGVTKRGTLENRRLYQVMKNYTVLDEYDGIFCGHLHDHQDELHQVDGIEKRFAVLPAWYSDAPQYGELCADNTLLIHRFTE